MNRLVSSLRSANRRPARSLGRITVAALLVAGLSTTALGCGGKGKQENRNAKPAMTDRGSSDTMTQASTGVSADEAASMLSGAWTVTLNPDQVSRGNTAITVPMALNVGQFEKGRRGSMSAPLTGTLAGTDIADARVSTGGDNATTFSFTAGEFDVDGLTMPISLPAGVTWTATAQSDGTLTGTAVGPDGSSSAWTASKN